MCQLLVFRGTGAHVTDVYCDTAILGHCLPSWSPGISVLTVSSFVKTGSLPIPKMAVWPCSLRIESLGSAPKGDTFSLCALPVSVQLSRAVHVDSILNDRVELS